MDLSKHPGEADVLYYVGCTATFDKRLWGMTRAVVKVLEKDVTLLLPGDSLAKVTKPATSGRCQAILLFHAGRNSCIGDNGVKIC